ncbi:MAG TPA: translation elongation factor Ts [Phycisphaerales bacterium]|nr:translation elongation factor Ts [Phycisphaerales bacterium]
METATNFSAKDVMKLREKTGLGMMDCKEALATNGGDPAKAEEWLKAKLKGKMDTRTERTTAEGRVGVMIKGSDAAIVEVQTETDFTARNPEFAAMVQDVLTAVLKQPAGEVQADAAMTKRVDDVRIKTGENMRFVRGEHLQGGSFGSYVHHDGKRGAIVQVEGGAVDADTLSGICMHIVAHVPPPVAVSAEDMPAAELENVRQAGVAEAKESGKPEDIAKKIAEGKVRKYLEENTLLNQMYVKDPSGKKSVKDVLPKGVKIVKFVRYTLGG